MLLKRRSLESTCLQEQNGTSFSFVAPSSEELGAKMLNPTLLSLLIHCSSSQVWWRGRTHLALGTTEEVAASTAREWRERRGGEGRRGRGGGGGEEGEGRGGSISTKA